MRKQDLVWLHWTVVSAIGGKVRVKCNYCSNEQLKNAVKCKKHLSRCQSAHQSVVQQFGRELRDHQWLNLTCGALGSGFDGDVSYMPTTMTTAISGSVENTDMGSVNDVVGDNCITFASGDGSAVVTADGQPFTVQIDGPIDVQSDGGSGGTLMGDTLTITITDGLAKPKITKPKVRKRDTIWMHWTDITDDNDGKRRVKCNYCSNIQLKNASKCKRHIIGCQKTTAITKNRYLNEKYIKTLVANSSGQSQASGLTISDVMTAIGESTGDGKLVKLLGSNNIIKLRAENNRLVRELGFSDQMRAILEAQRNYLVQVVNDCSNCLQREEVRQRLDEFDANISRLKTSQVLNRLSANKGRQTPIVNESIWRHWTDVSTPSTGAGRPVAVRCNYCANVQLKNAVKCKRHIINCRHSDLNVKNLFIEELRLKKVAKTLSQSMTIDTITRTNDDAGDDNSLDGNLERFSSFAINKLAEVDSSAGTAKPITDKRFKCDSCPYETDNSQRLVSHRNRQHLDIRPFQCDICDKVFLTQENLIHHQKNIHADPETIVWHSCDWMGCQFRTKYHSSLTVHRLQHLGIKEFLCQWPGCPMGFYTNKDLRKHEVTHNKVYRCEWVGCGAVLKSSANLKRHKLLHTTDQSRPYPCLWPGCDKRFQFSSFLTLHMRRHRGDRPHECLEDGCDKRFFEKTKMLNHYRRTHCEPHDYPCAWPGCDSAYKTNNHLERHMKTTHTTAVTTGTEVPDTSDQPMLASPTLLSCQWPGCDKQFKMKRNLNTHLRYHRSEAVHKCDWPDCDRRFKSRDVLRQHLMAHRGERPYVCPFDGCGRAFIRRTLMTSHYHTHESAPEFQCPVADCGKQFWSNACLRRHHRQVHRSVDDRLGHQCPVDSCGRRFSSADSLATHQLTHDSNGDDN